MDVRAWLVVVLVAQAHEPGACPPLGTMQQLAEVGRLAEPHRACLDGDLSTEEGQRRAWVLWRDAYAREGAGSAPKAARLLAATTLPDPALIAAELLVDAAPDVAEQAVIVARANADRWRSPVERADRVARLAAVEARLPGTDRIPLAPPPPPIADELVACVDVGALWWHAVRGRAYATERDCAARALDGMPPGAGLTATADLALALAQAHSDRAAAAVVEAHVREAVARSSASTGGGR